MSLLRAAADHLNSLAADEGPSGWIIVSMRRHGGDLSMRRHGGDLDAVPFTVVSMPGLRGRWTIDFSVSATHLFGIHGTGGRVSVAREVDSTSIAYAIKNLRSEPAFYAGFGAFGGEEFSTSFALALAPLAPLLKRPLVMVAADEVEEHRPVAPEDDGRPFPAGNLALRGRPGAGKTMWARRLAWRAPAVADAAELAFRYGLAGMPPPAHAPFRVPHHTVSALGALREAQLAYGGTLFLDEAVEFSSLAIDAVVSEIERGDARVVLGFTPPEAIGILGRSWVRRQDELVERFGCTVVEL